MEISELLAREASALRAGTHAVRRAVRGNEKQAAALVAYGAACLAMVLLVTSTLAGGGSRAALTADAAPATAAPPYHRIAKGETLAAIAERFGLTVTEIRALNDNVDPLALAPGTRLRLQASAEPVAVPKPKAKGKPKVQVAAAPTVAQTEPAQEGAAAASASGGEPAEAGVPQARATHHVASGDTLSAIAGRYGTTVAALLELNPGVDPYALKSGQPIRVP